MRSIVAALLVVVVAACGTIPIDALNAYVAAFNAAPPLDFAFLVEADRKGKDAALGALVIGDVYANGTFRSGF